MRTGDWNLEGKVGGLVLGTLGILAAGPGAAAAATDGAAGGEADYAWGRVPDSDIQSLSKMRAGLAARSTASLRR